MDGPPPIAWRVHLSSGPDAAFSAWTTDAGRECFWAQRSVTSPDGFTLSFSNGQELDVRVLENEAPHRFAFRYFDGTRVTLEITAPITGGCDLHLREDGHASERHRQENNAGWVSVLLAFKAAVDFGIDLRNRDPGRSLEQGFVDV